MKYINKNDEDENYPLVYSTDPKPKPLPEMKCISCDKVIDRTEKTSTLRPDGDEWNHGMVGTIAANYGSIHDSDVFFIAICDDCITKKKEEGTLIYRYNYLFDKQGDVYEYHRRSTE